MAHLVMIITGVEGGLRTAICQIPSIAGSAEIAGDRCLYARLFNDAFDALAHKLLLEKLSRVTLKHIVEKHRESTNILLSRFSKV